MDDFSLLVVTSQISSQALYLGDAGLTAPKRVRGAQERQWEGECCFFFFFFAAGMKRKESARKNLQTSQQVERSWSQL
ncbi:hypothetical protein TNCV_4802361 [Trichonephila clavipes]|nr:hypothetical protein TNCV_4802361 [Trichonephila clavipes]